MNTSIMTNEERDLTLHYLYDMLNDYIEGDGYERHPLPEWFALDKAIQVIEQTKWTLCSEKLPEYNGRYQCTAILDDLSLTVELLYKDGKWLDHRRIAMNDAHDIYGYGNTTEWHKLSYEELNSEFDWTANVIAWMPIFEPYEEASA